MSNACNIHFTSDLWVAFQNLGSPPRRFLGFMPTQTAAQHLLAPARLSCRKSNSLQFSAELQQTANSVAADSQLKQEHMHQAACFMTICIKLSAQLQRSAQLKTVSSVVDKIAYAASIGKVQAFHNVHKLLNPLFHGHHHQIVSSVVVSSQLSFTKCK